MPGILSGHRNYATGSRTCLKRIRAAHRALAGRVHHVRSVTNETRVAGGSPAIVIVISRRNRKALKSNRCGNRPRTSSNRSRSRPSIRGIRRSLDHSPGRNLDRNLDSLCSRRSHGKRLPRRVGVPRFRCRTRRTCPS